MTKTLTHTISQSKVNSWSNYETFAAAQWAEGRNVKGRAGKVLASGNAAELAAWLKAQFERKPPATFRRLYGDLLVEALASVNYHEIAGKWVAEARLAAAAHDLLAALEAIVKAADRAPHAAVGHVIEHGEGKGARSAIAEATGRSA